MKAFGRIAVHVAGASLMLALGMAAPQAHAASFDCAVARTAVEHVICGHDALGALDGRLADAYAALRGEAPVARRAGLLQQQRDWLRERNACGADADCLLDTMQGRVRALDAQLREQRAAFDRAVRSIPDDPAGAARQLSAYDTGLAAAWRVYLARFEPASGVSAEQARDLRAQSIRQLREDDGLSASILDDVIAEDEARGDFTLLRMWLERAPDNADGDRAHCFVFRRQPDLAFETMGAFYGSTRDVMAPVCNPESDLFDAPAWARLEAAFEPITDDTHGMDSGSIRFAGFAEWRLQRLRLSLSPLDYLDPTLYASLRGDPMQAIDQWAGTRERADWSPAARAEAQAALAQVHAVIATWLRTKKALPADQADAVADAFLQIWVGGRTG